MSNINWGSELDKVEEATKPIAAGTANFRIVEAKPTKAASSGSEMIRLQVKVEGGPDDGKTTFVNLVFGFDNPRAMKMTLKRLAGLGITAETLKAENPSIAQIAAKLIGRSATGTVTHREWNGEIQNDVDFMSGSGTPSGVPDAPSIPRPDVQDIPPTPSVPTAPIPDVTPTPDAAPAAPPSDKGF